MKPAASNIQTVKSDNRALILGHIRRCPVSRAELARKTGLTRSAVTKITNELLREGLLREGAAASPAEASPAAGLPGRRPVLLDLAADAGYALGVILHRKNLAVCVTDLKAEPLAVTRAPAAGFAGDGEALDWITAELRALPRQLGLPPADCAGIGVSCPGPLDCNRGVVLEPPGFPFFHRAPLAAMLGERLGLPVSLENNAVLLAMTEYLGGRLAGYHNTLFVVAADGIGSALLREGEVFRGLEGFAGELGHTSVDYRGLLCPCGNRGCLEQYATLAALRARHGFGSYEALADAAWAGEPGALGVIGELAELFACALTNAVNLMDLDSVVLYGEYGYRPRLLTERIENLLRQRCALRQARDIAVLPSGLPPRAAERASVAMVLHRYFFRPPGVKID